MDVALQGTTNTYSMIRERIYETRRELEELGFEGSESRGKPDEFSVP
jgi:hypothetical protein